MLQLRVSTVRIILLNWLVQLTDMKTFLLAVQKNKNPTTLFASGIVSHIAEHGRHPSLSMNCAFTQACKVMSFYWYVSMLSLDLSLFKQGIDAKCAIQSVSVRTQ